MGSLKALQEWCRLQCEEYSDVDVKNMSSSFRDGLAFCAIIHRFRPDLIDFSTLSKENVYENNRLAFEVAEAQLGIPALLDPEDMVSMKVPDRLSIITYVSQYYNFFTNKSHANPPCMKRPAGSGQGEPAQKRLMAPQEDTALEAEPAQTGLGGPRLKSSTLSSACSACLKHVHLVQRFMVDGKLYHRNCFRCIECSSTLLPGSYKMGKESGSLICTHHFNRPALANQNGRPDLSQRPAEARSARIGRSPSRQEDPPPESEREMAAAPAVVSPAVAAPAVVSPDRNVLPSDCPSEFTPSPTPATAQSDALIIEEEDPSVPPNPFGDSDDEEEEEEEEEAGNEEEKEEKEVIQTPAKETSNDDTPPAAVGPPGGVPRPVPVPAPRRVPEATPPPRPAPRARPQPPPERQQVKGERQKPRLPPKPRERSHSPGSQSIDSPKPKDPPWLALVQSESKKKPAPPPPPAGLATPPRAGSVTSLKVVGSRPGLPPKPAPANPFDDDEDEEGDVAEEEEEAVAVPTVAAAVHPWYSITQATEAEAADTPPGGGATSRSSSPGGGVARKRAAPRAPRAPPAPEAPEAIPALSAESLSSGSDHGPSPRGPSPRGPSPSRGPSPRGPSPSRGHSPRGPSPRGPSPSRGPHLELPFTKSASEPSISSPPASPSSCSDEPRRSLGSSPPDVPTNTSSAPATPQTNRSEAARSPRHPPPPRPPTATPSPLASETPAGNSKRPCKENPFNRKASPSDGAAKTRPPRGPRPARPPAPGHGFPLIKRKVQSDQYIPVEDIHDEMRGLERQLDQLEQRGVELETKLRDSPSDEEEERLLVEWFTLIHDKHLLVRREAELVYTSKQQNLEERQADVEYELRCLLNKPEKDWSEADRTREQGLMADLVTVIEQRNQIINNMDQDRQRDEEEDKLMADMLKKKDFHKEPDGEAKDKEKKKKKKKAAKFKPMKVLKRLSHKGDPSQTPSPRKDKS
ncbi:MICAL-like protein 1 isoform X2 [Gadus macrocephalus]|uniref:MICAL-like protein 1 isoform X2 n=1 Tax=Gadus macrocephalus TaxID=80720 RepID=UPI0028CB6307|nr:MICAL-like protein 1 isoform X2 [Gadus macrocephalus]